jgi:putative tryptophan/tyrosine transport system substrate-binding protein
MLDIRRREFITLLGSAAAWPIVARAQQTALPVIGFLHHATAAVLGNRVVAFRQGLNEAGFIEGRNVIIEFLWAEDDFGRLPALAADLVRRRVTVIAASGTAASTAKAATTTIPIVFISGNDPVDEGLVTSLNPSGGNLTGVSFTGPPLDLKRLELLHELAPKPSTIGVLFGPRFDAKLQQDFEAAARTLGRDIIIAKAETDAEIDAAFATIVQTGARALFVSSSSFFTGRRRQITALAARYALLASYETREYVEIGGLMSYGASPTDAYRRGGVYVGRILKGEKTGDLPVQAPVRYELVINLNAAKAIGLTVPSTLLNRANELIE